MKNRLALIIGTMVLGATLAGAQVSEEVPLQSQPEPQSEPGPQSQQAQAEPASGVARISLIHGDVSTQRGDSGDWATAALNQPVVGSDKVSTGVDSRAEVQLDNGNILRLGDNTLAGVAGISRTQIQIQLQRGLIDYTVFKGADAAAEIDTANVAIRPAQMDGVYRVEVNSDGETQVIVRKGSVDISTPQGSTTVEKGQMVIVRGVAGDTQYKVADAPSKDNWDTWNSERDRTIRDAQSWNNTNRNYVGSEDLDAYGRWQTVPNYGPVWVPAAAGPGWAPYRSGRWVWEPGWGWTWVSYEPWGWAPYHYGRWFVYNSSWVWWPGPARGYPAYRPVWAPAYVSFFGFGGGIGVGVGFGFGSVGWLPVGPCDRFYPWYGRYGSRYNVVNVTTINNFHGGSGFGGVAPLRAGGAYSNLRMATMNDRVRGGISSVPTGQFGTGRSTPVGVNGETFRGGRMIAGSLPVVPTRAALSVSGRPAAASTIPRGGQNQTFYSKTRPAAAPPSFDRQVSQVRQSIQRNGVGTGQSFSRTDGTRGANQNLGMARPTPGVRTPAVGAGNSAAAGSSNERSSDGWRTFSNSDSSQHEGSRREGSTNRSSGSSPGAMPNNNVPRPGNYSRPSASTNDPGWRHFTPQPGGGAVDRVNGGGGMNNAGRMNGGGATAGPGYQRGSAEIGGPRGTVQESPRSYSRPPLEMRQPIVTPRGAEVRSAPRESAPSRGNGGGGGGGGSRGGSGGSSHGSSSRH